MKIFARAAQWYQEKRRRLPIPQHRINLLSHTRKPRLTRNELTFGTIHLDQVPEIDSDTLDRIRGIIHEVLNMPVDPFRLICGPRDEEPLVVNPYSLTGRRPSRLEVYHPLPVLELDKQEIIERAKSSYYFWDTSKVNYLCMVPYNPQLLLTHQR